MGITGITNALSNFIFTTLSHDPGAADTLSRYMEPRAEEDMVPWHLIYDTPDWLAYGKLALYGLFWAAVIISVIVCIRLLTKHFSASVRDAILKKGFVIVWIYGFVVYDIGMCTGQYISLLTNAPMAIIYAFKIFLFDSDVSEIHAHFHESWFYSANFALAHFLAAAISTLFLIKYFGFNILARIRMWNAARMHARNVKETFVFWGFNEQSVNLVKSIKLHYGNSKDYRIVIMRTGASKDESPAERTGFARIFDFLAMPDSELESLQELGCLTTSTYSTLSGLNVTDHDQDILGKILKQKYLKRIIREHTLNKVHLLFLSDDEKENLHDVTLLLNDATIREFADEGSDDDKTDRAIFYCLARYNSIHRVIEDQKPSSEIKVKVVDSSHINVEMLKQNEELLPVNYVEVEKDATVSSAFNALVVGFSEVGMDATRFLYEFGAFVKHGGTNTEAVRSEFHLDVVDKNMADLAGTFVANAPAIKPEMPFLKDEDGNAGKPAIECEDNNTTTPLITLHQMDCRSVQFYQKLSDEWIQKLNYVVVATDDDELNLSLGVRIFKAAARYRQNLEHFCILVRAHNDDDGHINSIAAHYNRLWEAYKHAPESKDGRVYQNKIKPIDEVNGPIHVFGLDKTTFTYDNIIADELEQKARTYADNYTKTVYPDTEIDKSAWEDRYNRIMQLIGDNKGFSPTYCGMLYLRRTQSQDLANSLHETTKNILFKKALSRCHLEDFVFSRITREPDTTKYIWPRDCDRIEEIDRIAIVIAQTEHLRWMASHEILGYVLSNVKDEVRFQHNCLKNWAELTERYRGFDCNVSDYILGIQFSR